MNEKLKLIREIEQVCGFKRFRVSKKSTNEELNEILSYICTAASELKETFVPKIDDVFDNEKTVRVLCALTIPV